MKQYVGISRDHSGSMSGIARAAMNDYNQTIEELERASGINGIDTIVSVVGHYPDIRVEVENSSFAALRPLTSYPTPGGRTPLFQSIERLIRMLEKAPDADKATFLVMAVTDGEENVLYGSALESILRLIRDKQATDRWTFVFRVPKGGRSTLTRLGIPAGNIQEWEQTERGFQEATNVTRSAISNYYGGVSKGLTSSKTFYADLANVSQRTVAANMHNISGEVRVFPVKNREQISSFLSRTTGYPYIKGTGFYQLIKSEKAVQDYKTIIVRNQNTGDVYAGNAARDLLNLPHSGTISLKPGNHGDWDIFIQSTSDNRVLPQEHRSCTGETLDNWRSQRKQVN